MSTLTFSPDATLDIPLFRQLVQSVNEAIAKSKLNVGDALPSVNYMCSQYQLSRDTVFKAYSVLKEEGTIESVPNKGYYVASETRKVLLLIDTLKAYKEVLYHSFIDNISKNTIVDVQFHHYNSDNFKTIVNNSLGKYSKYVVMPFKNEEVASVLEKIDPKKLLVLDFNWSIVQAQNRVFQDFGIAFYKAISKAIDQFKKYKNLCFIYPEFTDHPYETVTHFKQFCKDHQLAHTVLTDVKNFSVTKGTAYICVSDRMLGRFLEQCNQLQLEPGKDVGFLSYNETPMKKFIHKGISVVSTDFKALGMQAAQFINDSKPIHKQIPTELILRNSL